MLMLPELQLCKKGGDYFGDGQQREEERGCVKGALENIEGFRIWRMGMKRIW